MKKRTVSKLTRASLVLGAASGISLVDAHAAQQLSFNVLGSAAQVRSEVIQMNGVNGQPAPLYLGSHEKDAEGKCGEGNCGEGEDKSAEGSCGENKDGKSAEGSCGANKGKEAEGSCGANKGKEAEGSCGGSNH